MKALLTALAIGTTVYIGMVATAVRIAPARRVAPKPHEPSAREIELEARVKLCTERMKESDAHTYTLLEGERRICLDELKRIREVGYLSEAR